MKVIRSSLLPVITPQQAATGYSLIETMIAMTFLLIVMMGLAQGMLVSFGMNRNSKNNLQGLAIAQRMIEDVQNKYGRTLADYNSLEVTINLKTPVQTNYSPTGEKLTGSPSLPSFVAAQTVILYPAATPSYKLVRISVTPQLKGFGTVQSVTLETYLIKPQS